MIDIWGMQGRIQIKLHIFTNYYKQNYSWTHTRKIKNESKMENDMGKYAVVTELDTDQRKPFQLDAWMILL